MTIQEFDKVREYLHENRMAIVMAKRPEYTEGKTDVLANFKQVAAEMGITPMQAWYVYFRKHLSSICAYIKNPDLPLSEPIGGRVMDVMNYMELFAALSKEYHEQQH